MQYVTTRARRAPRYVRLAGALVAMAALAVHPLDLDAQRRGPGARGGDGRAAQPMGAGVRLMLAEATALKLSDDQVARLTAIRTQLEADVAPMRARIDSLRPERGTAGGDRDALRQRRQAAAEVMRAWRERERQARTEALVILSDVQKAEFEQLEGARRKDGGERRRRRGGPPGRSGTGR